MAIFLLINSVGYTIYAHYCDEELIDTSILVDNTKSCCEDEAETKPKEEPMSCCKEKGTHVVIKDHFVKSEIKLSEVYQPVFQINLFDYQNVISLKSNSLFNPNRIDRPPISNFPDIIILQSVFRI